MGVFDNDNTTDEAKSKEIFKDALDLATFSYRGIDDGFINGYEKHGFKAGLPLTMTESIFGSTTSQGVLQGVPYNTDANAQAVKNIESAGWKQITPEQLGYSGKTDSNGTYLSSQLGYTSSQVEIMGKYDDSGKLTEIGIGFRGTSGSRGPGFLADTLGDGINDAIAAINSHRNEVFTEKAYGDLLNSVANFAQQNDLKGSDVVVSGHSLGGLMVNSMAYSSDTQWGGFFSDSNYIGFASPTQFEGGKVLNIGYENDPVFRVLNGFHSDISIVGAHDQPHQSTADNIVNFNDYYASDAWNLLPSSIGNISSWISHMPSFYEDGLHRVLNSEFYSLTNRDSTVIVSNLSDPAKANTWVEDLNRKTEPHTGDTFIIGSQGDDLIRGGGGNDYLEGLGGNDKFSDTHGYNLISGGEGDDLLILGDKANYDIALDGNTLFIRNESGEITQAKDIEDIKFNGTDNYSVHDNSNSNQIGYSASVHGTEGDDVLHSTQTSGWIFGGNGNDQISADHGNQTFVAGNGNDTIDAKEGNNTFLFNGDFGKDLIKGFSATDKIVFTATDTSHLAQDHHNLTSVHGNDLLITLGNNQVTLIGAANMNVDEHILIA
ncbi:polyurethanase [Rosenbergiella nectarea]|uniref:polyurethane esterase n=1 Tax=Rosenbergiella nectarea TaxID=988801 RepID=UPI001F4E1256|nr:polyurethanase [Rosenbergiella nectarea]